MILLLACCHMTVQLYACTMNADAGPLLVLTTVLLLCCPLRACGRFICLRGSQEPYEPVQLPAVRTRVLPLCHPLPRRTF
jgi:hypothetical protein